MQKVILIESTRSSWNLYINVLTHIGIFFKPTKDICKKKNKNTSDYNTHIVIFSRIINGIAMRFSSWVGQFRANKCMSQKNKNENSNQTMIALDVQKKTESCTSNEHNTPHTQTLITGVLFQANSSTSLESVCRL